MNNPGKLIINPTNEFHVLRHFKFVDDLYKQTLLNKLYWYYDYNQKQFVSSKITKTDIENALQTIGTKFDKNITGIENPKELLEVIKDEFKNLILTNKINWVDNFEYKTFTFSFNYKLPVGQQNCLPINSITEQDRIRIRPALRSNCLGEDGVKVNAISRIELQFTNAICVEIIETKQFDFYTITAYPDCLVSPDLSLNELVFVV